MIIDLPDTDTQSITKELRALQEERGEVTSGRVLTFIVVADGDDDLSRILDTIHDASREHPARVIVLVTHPRSADVRLDGQIRMGGDAGASELIVMHLHGEMAAHRASVVTPLLLPDTPIVAWWTGVAPRNPAADPIGELAQRRITDAFVEGDPDVYYRRRLVYAPGDSDLVWSRITLWRAALASLVEQPPLEDVLSVDLYGPEVDPAVDIAAGWLADRLDVPVSRHNTDSAPIPLDDKGREMVGIQKAVLNRPSGPAVVEVRDAHTVAMTAHGKTSLATLSRRNISDCLAEELRHLEPDETYGRALRRLVRVHRPRKNGHNPSSILSLGTLDQYNQEGSNR